MGLGSNVHAGTVASMQFEKVNRDTFTNYTYIAELLAVEITIEVGCAPLTRLLC